MTPKPHVLEQSESGDHGARAADTRLASCRPGCGARADLLAGLSDQPLLPQSRLVGRPGRTGWVLFDAELLYIAALLHDLGLVARFDTGRCFEEDSAAAAADLAAVEGWPDERREALAEAIRLHVAIKIALEDGPEAYLLWHATGLDVTGHRHGDVTPQIVEKVVAAYPRLDFKHGFTELIADQAARKPVCWAAVAAKGGIGERIAAAPFAS